MCENHSSLWQTCRKRRLWSTILDVGKYFAVMAALGWFLLAGTERLGYHWQWYRVSGYLYTLEDGRFHPGPLMEGLAVTLKVSGISFFLSFLLGMTTALLRLSDSLVGRTLARIYLEIIRNTPLLVQIFFIYFVLGPLLSIPRLTAAVLALSLFEGAYASEIFRAGILSIDKGQWEAAQSLGLNRLKAYRHVILPQAIRYVLPPLTSQTISLIKDSALVSTIAIYDLTMRGQAIVAQTFLTFEIWFTVAGIYLAVTVTLSTIVSFLENHLRVQA